MFTKKEISNLRARINKDNKSISCMGAMMLTMEFQGYTVEKLKDLQATLLDSKKPLVCDHITKELLRREI